jgi:hypothetical protein
VAIFQVIDTSSSGDDFDVGMMKTAINFAILEAMLEAPATETNILPLEFDGDGNLTPVE